MGGRNAYKGRGRQGSKGWVITPKADDTPKLDKETEAYFSKVYSRFQSDFEDDEDKAVFLANVAEQTCKKELELSYNRSASYCVQMLLTQTTDPNVLTRFMTMFSDNLRTLCTHYATSHVVQALLEAALKYLRDPSLYIPVEDEPDETTEEEGCAENKTVSEAAMEPADTEEKKDNEEKEEKEEKENEDEPMEAEEVEDKEAGKKLILALQSPHEKVTFWVLRMGRFCMENLKEFMLSPLASHVTRTVVQVLGGCNVESILARNRKGKSDEAVDEQKKEAIEAIEVPKEFVELLREFTVALKDLPDLLGIIKNNVTSLLVQALMIVLRAKDEEALASLVEHIGKTVFVHPPQDGGLAPALLDTSASFMVEKVLKYSSPESFSKLWKDHLSGHLLKMAVHPVANFCVQRAIECATTAEQFEEMYEELAPGFTKLMTCGHTTVLVCIAEACVRLSTHQSKFLTALMEMLHCAEPVERNILLVPLALHLMTYESYNDSKPRMKVIHQGSLLLQQLFNFTKTKKVVDSLLSMEADVLKGIGCCPRGSHVLDAFLQGPSIREKSRDTLVEKLKGHFYELSIDKYGSRVLGNLWNVATLTQKVAIAEELSQKEHLLTASTHGGFVAKKFGIYHFKHRRNDWNQLQKSKEKAAILFQDIIEDE